MGAAVDRYFPEFPGSMLEELVETCVLDLKAYGYAVSLDTRAAIVLQILRLTRLRITEGDEVRRQIFEKFAT